MLFLLFDFGAVIVKGISMPIAHVEESWQMAEFYNNKVLFIFVKKPATHIKDLPVGILDFQFF